MDQNQTLWIDLQNLEYFIVPNDLALPAGDTVLLTLAGQVEHVDSSALADWQVAADEIQTHLQAQVSQIFAGLEQQVDEVFASVKQGPSDQSPHLSLEDLYDTFYNLTEALADIMTRDEERLQSAHRRVRTFRMGVQKLGIEIPPVVDTWPVMLRTRYEASDNQVAWYKVLQGLRGLLAQLDELRAGNRQGLAQTLLELDRLRKELLGSLFPRPETEDEKRQRYRDMARQAMPKIPRPDVKKMVSEYKQRT